MATQPGGSVTSRATSDSRAVPGGSGGPHHDSATVTGAKFRHGLLQLMIHTIDPMHDGMCHFFFQHVYKSSHMTECFVSHVVICLVENKNGQERRQCQN